MTDPMTGQQWAINHYVSTSQSVGYDGDGVKVKDVAASVTSYYLRSSALSGAIVEELNSSGQKNVGYVYSPGGGVLARQTPAGSSSYITWKHTTPVGPGEHDYNVGGVFGSGAPQRIELDPLGANVGLEYVPPPEVQGQGDLGQIGGLSDSRWSNFFDLSGGCTAAGVAASCSGAMTVTNDAAMQSLFGSRWFDLPGNFDNQALGEERYLRIMADGYDIELGHYRGSVTVTSSTGTVITLTNPTQEQLDAAYQTAYGADSGSSDQDDHAVSTAYHVSIIGGPMYFAPQNTVQQDNRTACEHMADDAQRIAGETRNDYPNATAAWALQEFNKRYGQVTFASYFAETPLGFLGTPASGRNVGANRSYEGNSGFPEQFRDTLRPWEDQVHHFGAFFSAGLAGHKLIPDQHRADDRDAGNMGDVRLGDQSRRLGDYLRKNPNQLSNVGKLIKDVICGAGAVPK